MLLLLLLWDIGLDWVEGSVVVVEKRIREMNLIDSDFCVEDCNVLVIVA